MIPSLLPCLVKMICKKISPVNCLLERQKMQLIFTELFIKNLKPLQQFIGATLQPMLV